MTLRSGRARSDVPPPAGDVPSPHGDVPQPAGDVPPPTAPDPTDPRTAAPTAPDAETSRLLAQLADAMPQLVWTAGEDGIVDYYNARAADYAGLIQDADGHYRWQTVIHPDDLAATWDVWRAASAQERPYEHEHRIQMVDGSFRWHLSRAVPRRDPLTGALRWYGTATDIHDLRSTREALASTQSSLALALRAGRMGWWTRDLETGVVTWSPELEEIFGLPPGGFAGDEDRFLSFVHPDDRHLVTDAVAGALARRVDYQVEFRFRHVDGTERWMEGRGSGMYDGDRAIGLTGVGIDITDRRSAAELRDTFIGMLSHELRTPVTSIVGAGHMLRRPDLASTTREELIEDVVVESQRLERLVENLLVLARAERGAVEGGHDPVLVRPVLAQVIAEQARLTPRVRVAVEPAHDVPPILGDEAAVELIVRNLVSNAAKYGPADGTVRVRVTRDDDTVAIEVEDEGPGLPPGDELRIFELFYRSPGARRAASGAGIGLYVVRVLVEAMRGRISARNGPGGGACLTVRLPVYHDEDAAT